MPSKRTNDSVERILEELSHQQTRDGVRDSVNDRKVDEILRSVGIDTAAPGAGHDSLGPIGREDLPAVEIGDGKAQADDRFSTTVLDDILGDLPTMQKLKKARPAPAAQAPARPAAPAQPARRPAPAAQKPAQPATQPARPAQAAQPAPKPAPAAQKPTRPAQAARPAAPVQTPPAQTAQPAPAQPQRRQTAPAQDTAGDTTRTSIIKNFLIKMAPGAEQANTRQLNAGKEQFQQFFGKTAAVLPDEKGKLRDPGQKRRGLFGLGKAEDTGEFVPINVSLGGRRAEPAAASQPAPQAAPETPQPPELEEYKEEYSTEEYAEEYAEEYTGEYAAEDTAAPQPGPAMDLDAADDGEAETLQLTDTWDRAPARRGLFGGLFGRRAPQSEPAEDYGDTYASLHLEEATGTVPDLEPLRSRPAPAAPAPEKTVYHSRQFAAQGGAAPAQPAARQTTRTGATGTIYRKKRNTIEFTPGQHKKRAAPAVETPVSEPVGEPVLTPAPRPQPEPAEPAVTRAPESAAPAMEPAAEPISEPISEPAAAPESAEPAARADTFEELSAERAATLTGEVRLAGIAAGEQPPRAGHSGFTTELAPESAPAQPAPAASSGFSAQLYTARPGPRPDTLDFVRGIEESINQGAGAAPAGAPAPDRFAQAAAILTDPTAEARAARPARPKAAPQTKGVRLDGEPEDEGKEGGEPPFEEEETQAPARRHEYERADDAPAIRRDLDSRVLALTAAAIVAGAAALVMLYLGTAAAGAGLPMPAPLDPAVGKTPLLATLLLLLLAAAGLCWRTMAAGLAGLLRAPTADTLPALAALGAAVQLLVLLIHPAWYAPDRLGLMAGPAALLLCLNTVGKRMDAATTRENFTLVSAGVDHAVAYRLQDAGVLRTVTRGLDQPRPSVLVSRPTRLLKDFLRASGAPRTSDKKQQQLARLAGGCALAALLFTLLYRRDAGQAVTAMAAVLCIAAPLAGTLLSALPAQLMQRSAAQVGAVVPGWRDIRQLGRVNVIQVSAQDLFPNGCVKLCGIRPIQKDHIDQAITYAASMLAQGAPTLREVFLGMIGDNRKLLCQVDDFETVYGCGHVGWINGERVLIGNRRLMQQFDIQLPSLDYEKRHTVNQRRVIYLAVSGSLFSMFLVSYQGDSDTAAVLDGLRRSGLSLIVDGDDFNCDEALLEAAYTLPGGSVRVLDAAARKALEPATAWLPESEGNMLHLGSFASLVGGLEAAAGAAEAERKASMVLSVSVLLSCVLSVVMVLAGGIAALPLPALVLYQAAWAVLALVFPMLQRY